MVTHPSPRTEPVDFMIIGAMKCATTSLHDSLAAQSGLAMSDPKEPFFFSDDDAWARGLDWYEGLFGGPVDAVRGESSTHYTKLPDHPDAVSRAHGIAPSAKLVYMVRDPIVRIVSQYIHDWTMNEALGTLDESVRSAPRYVAYSRYAYQLQPWIERYGHDRILLVSFDRFRDDPTTQIRRVGAFLGIGGSASWTHTTASSNASSERIRQGWFYRHFVENPLATAVRRSLIPKSVRNRVRSSMQMKNRPEVSPELRAWLTERLDPDIAEFGRLIGEPGLTCATFQSTLSAADPEWADA